MANPRRPQRKILKPGPFVKRRKALQRPLNQEIGNHELRKLFAQDRILEKAGLGELGEAVVEENHPNPPLANEPVCTLSQLVRFFDHADNTVAFAHRYLRPDGSVGLSGKPDPKELVHAGIHYIAELR